METDTTRGIFIVLEGTDGSGKGTQFKLLAERLRAAGHDVATFDFPQYEVGSSYFVKRYLNGEYGQADAVGPYTGSLFYALDRYDAAPDIRKALDDGKIVLANRFTASNMAHQGTKFEHAEQRRGYFVWLDTLEFETLHIPRPDLNIVLRVPAETAQQLVDLKAERSYTDKKRDLHEADLGHLQKAVEVYDDLCQLFPKDFSRIDCVRNGELLSIEAIARVISQKLEPLLPAPTLKLQQVQLVTEDVSSSNPTTEEGSLFLAGEEDRQYYVARNFDPATSKVYCQAMDDIFARHMAIVRALAEHIQHDGTTHKTALAQAQVIASSVLPIVAKEADSLDFLEQLGDAASHQDQVSLRQLVAETLPANHDTQPNQTIQLTDIWPRNELDIVPDITYSHSTLSLQQLRQESELWTYDRKADLLKAYLAQGQPGPVLNTVRYSWDIFCDYGSFKGLQRRLSLGALQWQTLTPRYGYEVPDIIDQAELTDIYEECFDLSLRLYSLLQQNGYATLAQYAILQGHRMRWTCSYTARDAFMLLQPSAEVTSQSYRILVQRMHELLAEKHPILTNLEHLDATAYKS